MNLYWLPKSKNIGHKQIANDLSSDENFFRLCSVLFCVLWSCCMSLALLCSVFSGKKMFVFCSVLCSSAIFSVRVVLVMIRVRRIRTNSQSTMIQILRITLNLWELPLIYVKRRCRKSLVVSLFLIHKCHNLWLIIYQW